MSSIWVARESNCVIRESVTCELSWEGDKTDQGKQRKMKQERDVGIRANLASTFHSPLQRCTAKGGLIQTCASH